MYSLLGSHLKLNSVELLGLVISVGITDLFDCAWISFWMSSATSVSTGNVVLGVLGVLVMIPGIDFLVVELSEIEIVLESLEDCICLTDTVRSLYSLISSCDLLFKSDFKPDFKGKSVLLVAFLEELLVSLGSDVSEMLEDIYLRLSYYFRERKFLEWEIWSMGLELGLTLELK